MCATSLHEEGKVTSILELSSLLYCVEERYNREKSRVCVQQAEKWAPSVGYIRSISPSRQWPLQQDVWRQVEKGSGTHCSYDRQGSDGGPLRNV